MPGKALCFKYFYFSVVLKKYIIKITYSNLLLQLPVALLQIHVIPLQPHRGIQHSGKKLAGAGAAWATE